MVRKIIQPWWIRKQIALTVARLPSWGLRCCRPREPLSEPRRGEFRRRAANTRANRTGNAACQEIVFESSWRSILHISFLNAHLLALRTRSIPRSKELGHFLLLTSLTVHTASAADRGAAKGAAANRAWFSAVSVNSKKRCVSIIFSFGLQIIFRRNRIFLNKIFQAFRDRNSKAFPFFVC